MFKVSILRNAAAQNRDYSKTLHFPGFRFAGAHVNMVTFQGRKIDISPFGILTLVSVLIRSIVYLVAIRGKPDSREKKSSDAEGKTGTSMPPRPR